MKRPLFLLPNKKVMVTATIKDGEVEILKDTIFPSNKKYDISKDGVVVCLDKEKKIVIYGKIKESGEIKNYEIINFPNFLKPETLCLYENHILFGGICNENFDSNNCEIICTYDLNTKEYKAVDMPFRVYGKAIDDFLIDGETVIAVDNIVHPKYLIEYDFSDVKNPKILKTHELPNNGPYERIKKATMNNHFLAIESSTIGQFGSAHIINIFRKGDYENYISLRNWVHFIEGEVLSNKIKLFYNDMIIIRNLLCISAGRKGFGFISLDDFVYTADGEEKNWTVDYINPREKNITKIIRVNEEEELFVIFYLNDDGVNEYELMTGEDFEDLYLSANEELGDYQKEMYYDAMERQERDSNSDRDYFDAMTDGLLGDYDNYKESGRDTDDLNDLTGR